MIWSSDLESSYFGLEMLIETRSASRRESTASACLDASSKSFDVCYSGDS